MARNRYIGPVGHLAEDAGPACQVERSVVHLHSAAPGEWEHRNLGGCGGHHIRLAGLQVQDR